MRNISFNGDGTNDLLAHMIDSIANTLYVGILFNDGTGQMASSTDRRIPRGARGPTYMQCRCCSEGVEESVQHRRVVRVRMPPWDSGRHRRPNPPEGSFVWDGVRRAAATSWCRTTHRKSLAFFNIAYLISLFASREARLDSLAAGGRPQGQLPSSDGSLRDPGSG